MIRALIFTDRGGFRCTEGERSSILVGVSGRFCASVATTPNPLGWLSGGVSLLIFLLYFILLEGAYGQTVGKMAVKIKVVQEDGTKIDYAGAAVRNILRVIDAIQFFIPYLLGAILIWTSDRKQRVGDRACSTIANPLLPIQCP